jgi:hypothetical protein
MKRLHVISKPTAVDALADFDTDSFESALQLRAERLETQRLRRFKRQLA